MAIFAEYFGPPIWCTIGNSEKSVVVEMKENVLVVGLKRTCSLEEVEGSVVFIIVFWFMRVVLVDYLR